MHQVTDYQKREKSDYLLNKVLKEESVLKPFAAKNGLSISVLCIAPFMSIILFDDYTRWLPFILVHYIIYLHSSTTIEMRCGVANLI